MNNIKDERIKEALKNTAAEFIGKESNHTSLITVTNIEIMNRGKNVTVLLSVLPEDKEEVVIDFLSRKRRNLREYLKTKVSMRVLPFFTFAIDHGEKNRRRIEEIITEDKNR